MTQYVRVQNLDGDVTNWIERPCFGFMSYINEWEFFFTSHGAGSRKSVVLPGDDEDDWDDDWDDDEDGDDKKHLAGFEPGNLKEIHWIVGIGDFDYPQIVKDLPEILKGSMFKHMRLEKIDGYDVIVCDIEGVKMDETILPLCILRNAFGNSYARTIEDGFSPYQAAVLSSCLHREKVLGEDKYNTWVNGGDNQAFEPAFTTMPNIIAILKETHQPNWWQGVWGEDYKGYSSYGTINGTGEYAPVMFPLNARAHQNRNKQRRMQYARANLKAAMFTPTLFHPRGITLHDLSEDQYETENTKKADSFYSRLKKAVLND